MRPRSSRRSRFICRFNCSNWRALRVVRNGRLRAARFFLFRRMLLRRHSGGVRSFLSSAGVLSFRHSGEGRNPFCSSLGFVIPGFVSSFPRKREPSDFALLRFTLAERSSLLGFARHPWRASHFLCLHKESNQRNAPSVTRRRQSRRFATVGRGLAAGHPALSPNAGRPGPHRVRCTRPCPSDLRRFTEGPVRRSL